MKTLKKTLCLILAVVMVVGVLILPAHAATSYPDDAKISDNYRTAVEILEKLGVFQGKPTGFDPQGTLERQEAAALMARIKLGVEASKSVPAVPSFSDVTADHWAAKQIGWAKNEGIIAGRTPTTFAPTVKVTGYELAKMLLITIGANASVVTSTTSANGNTTTVTTTEFNKTYTGDDWKMEVYKDLLAVGLNYGLDVSKFDEPITREETAQMIFTAIKWVKPTGETVVVDNDGVKTTEEVYTKPLLTTALKVAVNPYCHDKFGVPYVGWILDNAEIYQDYNAYTKVFDSATDGVFGGSNYTTYKKTSTAIHYNGSNTDTVYADKDIDNIDDLIVKSTSPADTRGITGYETQVYYIDSHYTQASTSTEQNPTTNHGHFTLNGATKYYDIVVLEANLAQVIEINDKQVEIEVYVPGITDGIKDCAISKSSALYDEIKAYGEGGYFAIYLQSGTEYKASGFTSLDSKILKTAAVEALKDQTVSKVVKNEIKGTNTRPACLATVTFDGKTYAVNNMFYNNSPYASVHYGSDALPKVKDEGTFYMLNGNVLGYVESKDSVSDNMIIITRLFRKANADGEIVTYVEGIGSNGEKLADALPLSEVNADNIEWIHSLESREALYNKVYEYTKQTDGYSFKAVTGTTAYGGMDWSDGKFCADKHANWDVFQVRASDAVSIKNTTRSIDLTAITWFTDDTVNSAGKGTPANAVSDKITAYITKGENGTKFFNVKGTAWSLSATALDITGYYVVVYRDEKNPTTVDDDIYYVKAVIGAGPTPGAAADDTESIFLPYAINDVSDVEAGDSQAHTIRYNYYKEDDINTVTVYGYIDGKGQEIEFVYTDTLVKLLTGYADYVKTTVDGKTVYKALASAATNSGVVMDVSGTVPEVGLINGNDTNAANAAVSIGFDEATFVNGLTGDPIKQISKITASSTLYYTVDKDGVVDSVVYVIG